MMIEDNSHYLVSLFQFSEDTNYQEFFAYCDRSAAIMGAHPGFRSAFGYMSTYEMAKYRYVGVTELESLDVLYEVLEDKKLTVRLTPPDSVNTMTLFARCRTNGYPELRAEHRSTTQSSVTFINPFRQPMADRDSEPNLELERRNLLLARSNGEFRGYKGFATTNPTAVHNYIAFAEFSSEAAFLEHMNSDMVKAANKGAESVNESGFPGIYKLVLAKTDDGFEFDMRIRETI